MCCQPSPGGDSAWWLLCKGGFGPLLGICIPLTPREAYLPARFRDIPHHLHHTSRIFWSERRVFVSESGVGGWGELNLSFSLTYIFIKFGLWSLCVRTQQRPEA